MKNLNIACYLCCCLLVTSLFSCEKADLNKASSNDSAQLSTRSDNCNNCPVEDCCCYVELTEGATSANLVFCGTTNPDVSTNSCGPVYLQTPCEDIIYGFEWLETLTGLDPKEFFCVEKGTSFMIGVNNLSGTKIRFTCQNDQLNPQFVTLNLAVGEKRFYTVDDDCELSECHIE